MGRAFAVVLFAVGVGTVAADELDDLIARLADKDHEVRREAEETLQARVGPGDLPRLEAVLAGTDYNVNYAIIRTIEKVGGEVAIQSLRQILQGENPTLAYYAYLSLARMKDAWSVDHVLELLADPDVADRRKQNLINALYSIPNERALPVLRILLQGAGNDSIRSRAIQLLADRKDTGSLEVLRALVGEESESEALRGAAGVALVRLGDETGADLVRSLIAAGKLPYGDLTRLLQSLQTREAAEPYFEVLRDRIFASELWNERVVIVDFLARRGDRKLLDRIDGLFDDEQAEVAEAAARAILTLGRSPENLKKYLADPDLRLRFKVEVAGALLLVDDFEGLAVLIEAAASEEALVRRSAVTHLGNARVEEVVTTLIERLADTDSTVRAATRTALGQTFQSIVPYSRFDWRRLGYDVKEADAQNDRLAIEILSQWWVRNRDAAR